MIQRSKGRYHHGDLAPLIRDLAIDEIAEHGIEQLSLRSLARKAGVSQAAPYRHFSTKTSLLAAIATQGFSEMSAQMDEILDSELPVGEQLVEMGGGYVEFAIENPVVYQIMFSPVIADFSKHEGLHEAAHDCLGKMQGLLKELAAEKKLDVHQQRLNGVVWSAMHGIASLQIRVRPTEYGTDKKAHGVTKAVSKDIRGSLRLLFGHLIE